ncbi:MAG: DNA translocase FtsK [Hyphomicrobiales bacterium]|nr:DNA translocase FtsK [Hyphomicrobiales bacterium]
MPRTPRRFLPEFMSGEARAWARRAFGAGLILLSAAGYASLVTWSADDPSFNTVTANPPLNALGRFGAALSDLLMQGFGLAASILLAAPMIWGWAALTGAQAHGAGFRAGQWFAGSLLLCGAASALPAPKSWLLANGLGGWAGDVIAAFFVRLGGFIEPSVASGLGAAVAAAGGAWMLMRAVAERDAVAAPTPYDEPEPIPAFSPRAAFQTRITSWAQKWRRSRALTVTPPSPREHWMTESPLAALAQAAESVKDKLVTAVLREPENAPSGDPVAAPRLEPHFGPAPRYAEDDEPSGWDGSRSQAPYRAEPDWRAHEAHAAAPEASDFALPPLHLLSDPPRKANAALSDDELLARAAALEGVLDDFGVKGRITRVHPGPVVTLYELEPARGTKSSRVIGLADDIARSMSAASARVSVIPGRDALGIELPNDVRETVQLRELLASPQFADDPSKLPLALGKTIAGQPLIADLARMPHLLIAGTTGSGKSVGINAMILSLLYRLTPAEARFIMIDPKMLELSVYDGIPHLLAPVVTDPKKAIAALKWTVNEMNARYEKMSKLGVRNISGYNQKIAHAQLRDSRLKRTVNVGFDELSGDPIYESEEIAGEPLPYIVVVIDEMADLMMAAGKEIEYCVMRLAQMARAAGIHVIMATQRPSVDVITGTIKANFPSRISYQVTSKIDSRTILGEQGAEQLLGAGDMLYMAAGGRISRAHGPFVSDGDLERVVGFLKSQGEPQYSDAVTKAMEIEDGEDAPASAKGDSGDDLYDEAVSIVLADKRPTTSYLQRRLGIGYNRAAGLIERMEEDGIVSAPNRTGKRDVLTPGAH